MGARRGGAARTLRAGEAAALRVPAAAAGAGAQPSRSPPRDGASPEPAAAGGGARPAGAGERAPGLVGGGVLPLPPLRGVGVPPALVHAP